MASSPWRHVLGKGRVCYSDKLNEIAVRTMDIIHNEDKTMFKANSSLGYRILVAVWRNCYSSPMDDGELLITPEDYVKATAAFQALGFNIKVGVKKPNNPRSMPSCCVGFFAVDGY